MRWSYSKPWNHPGLQGKRRWLKETLLQRMWPNKVQSKSSSYVGVYETEPRRPVDLSSVIWITHNNWGLNWRNWKMKYSAKCHRVSSYCYPVRVHNDRAKSHNTQQTEDWSESFDNVCFIAVLAILTLCRLNANADDFPLKGSVFRSKEGASIIEIVTLHLPEIYHESDNITKPTSSLSPVSWENILHFCLSVCFINITLI